jgi:hypothetical protein
MPIFDSDCQEVDIRWSDPTGALIGQQFAQRA